MSTHEHTSRSPVAHAEGEHEHYQPQVLTMPHADVTAVAVRQTSAIGSTYKMVLALFGILFVIGVVAFIFTAADKGFDTFTPWAYLMTAFAFIFTTAMSAPIFSVSQRMVRSHWRRPMSRASEIMSVVGILGSLLIIPLAIVLPDTENRKTIWFGFSDGKFFPAIPAPLAYEIAAVIGLALCGMAILYVGARPDFAAMRDNATGKTQRWGKMLARGWQGTPQEWNRTKGYLRALGAIYFLFLIIVHMFISTDFAMSLVPGWKDAVFSGWHAIGGLQSALACTILMSYLLYKFGGYKDYFSVDQFWGASKMLLALSLLWLYFWISGFMIFWYGRQPVESALIRMLYVETYRYPFILAVAGCWAFPFLMLMWNSARKSMLMPTIVSVIVLVGTFFNCLRIYVSSFVTADIRSDALHTLHASPLLEPSPFHFPNAFDVLMVIGVISGALFLIMLAIKIVPAISIWEVTEGMLYRKRGRFLKRDIMIMGKPD